MSWARLVAPGAAPREPRVHVLILNWNGWRDTIECLETVFRLEYSNFQVIVCDNASSDGSVNNILAWANGRLDASIANDNLRHLASTPLPKPIASVELDRADAELGGGERADEARGARLVVINTGD